MSGGRGATIIPTQCERLTLQCSHRRCAREGQGVRFQAQLGPYRAHWFQPPPGWWVLVSAAEGVPQVRCPSCLGAGLPVVDRRG